MRYVADLHIHSYLSRATSKDLNLETLHRWAQQKGIAVVATGDFTHPKWLAEMREKLVPAEPGLFRLRDDLAAAASAEVPAACRGAVRFMLSVEVSSIYKKGERVRKVHNLVYAPSFEAAAHVGARLARLGNIASDGRPILGVDSRDLLEITLESDPDAFLVPAHIWTPWFSMLGAQSGFDAVDECFGDLSQHIFAVETGLSSDPAMNWRLSQLDRFALISNSDAHSAEKLGREANLFDAELSFYGLRDALRDRREGFLGTIELFPEEGKYHFDGHRKCGVSFMPREVKQAQGLCPACAKPLTGGVMSRVESLSDRPEGFRPPGAKPFRSLIPLVEVLGEVTESGAATTGVRKAYERLLSKVGPELTLLMDAPLEDVGRAGPPLLDEALRRMRAGDVHATSGYDGEYGVIRVFDEVELRAMLAQTSFGFGPIARPAPRAAAEERPDARPPPEAAATELAPPLDPTLDDDQRRAVEHGEGPLLIVAGPGTGKTRTVVQRIAHLVRRRGVSARAITAITFTRKAAGELVERLRAQLGPEGAHVRPVAVGGGASPSCRPSLASGSLRALACTFHSFGLELLRAFPADAGLPEGFTVLDEPARRGALEAAGCAGDAKEISLAKARGEDGDPRYQAKLAELGAVDFDDLVLRAVRLLDASAAARAHAEERCRWLFVDEYQDINRAQYELVRRLAPAGANLCAVGDPDQSIYGFRGSDPSFFASFAEAWPGAETITLSRSYRCPAPVLRAAAKVVGREALTATRTAAEPISRWSAGSAEEEAELIAAEVERAVGGTSLYSVDSGRATGEGSLAFHDVAVLFRTAAQGDAIAAALDRAGIPYQRAGDDALLDRPEVRALIEKLPETAGGDTVAARVLAADPAIAGSHELRRAAERLAALAAPFGGDLRAFLDVLPLIRESDLRLEPQRVALLTLHASKGLEFPLVFIAGAEDGLLPLRTGAISDEAEERRLLYVGLTRAKRRLIVTWARRRKGEARPSPLLDGLELEDTSFAGKRARPKQLGLWST